MSEQHKELPQILVPTVTLSSEWDSDDPWVERIWSLVKELIPHLEIDDKSADEADFAADRLLDKLTEARNHYQSIKSYEFQKLTTSKQSSEYQSMYSALWCAYKDRTTKLLSKLGYEVGFMFGGKDFEKQATAFAKRHPKKAWLVDYSRRLRGGWQNDLYKYRNAHDHDGDLRNDVPDLDSLENAKAFFEVVCYVIEGIIIGLAEEKMRNGWLVVVMDEDETVFNRGNRYTIKHVLELNQPMVDS